MGVDLGSLALLYIAQETSLLVGYNVRVLVGLQIAMLLELYVENS